MAGLSASNAFANDVNSAAYEEMTQEQRAVLNSLSAPKLTAAKEKRSIYRFNTKNMRLIDEHLTGNTKRLYLNSHLLYENQLETCYVTSYKSNLPNAHLAANWDILPDGSVANVQLESADLNEKCHACMKRVIQNWRYGESDGSAHVEAVYILRDQSKMPPLSIDNYRINAAIDAAHATVQAEFVILNASNVDYETQIEFALPEGAVVTDFAIDVKGEMTHASVIEKDKAEIVYKTEVDRLADPGLLENIGDDDFLVKIYPIPANGFRRMSFEYIVPLSIHSPSESLLALPLPDIIVVVTVNVNIQSAGSRCFA